MKSIFLLLQSNKSDWAGMASKEEVHRFATSRAEAQACPCQRCIPWWSVGLWANTRVSRGVPVAPGAGCNSNYRTTGGLD